MDAKDKHLRASEIAKNWGTAFGPVLVFFLYWFTRGALQNSGPALSPANAARVQPERKLGTERPGTAEVLSDLETIQTTLKEPLRPQTETAIASRASSLFAPPFLEGGIVEFT